MFRSPPVDLIVILIIVLLIMGPKRLPGIGKGLGHGMREFKEGITGTSKHEEDEPKSAIAPASAMPESSPEARTNAAPQPVAAPVPPSSGSSEPGPEQRS
jgi:sec-independent protein translocase protein TatA